MHKLLARQIRKYFPADFAQQDMFGAFFEAVSKSYKDNDAKLEILQRSTVISSQELSDANDILRERAASQKKIIESLERSIASLDVHSDSKAVEITEDRKSFDPLALAKKLEEQSSEINRMSSEKDLLLKNLEERNEALNDYAHMVSHDLKSPMRNINFLIGCIKDDEIDNFSIETLDNCKLISENLQKMDALVDGILKHATVTRAAENRVQVDVNNFVAELVKTIYVPDHIKIKSDDALPTIFVDRYKLELLFKNLLINAITATEGNSDGEICISAKEESEFWQFSVADNGKGIAKQYQEDIFKMFVKLEDDFKATGVGLALVKKIVNSYGGQIWLKSCEGEGATFFFTIKK